MRLPAFMYDGKELMGQHAHALALADADILEIGFGHGVFTQCALAAGPLSYTVVDSDWKATADAESLLSKYAVRRQVLHGRWQDVVGTMQTSSFDAIMYDVDEDSKNPSSTLHAFVESQAGRLLRPGGRFTFRYAASGVDAGLIDALLTWSHMPEIDCLHVDPLPLRKGDTGERLVICACKRR